MRRRFEADLPVELPRVSPRARHVERPAPGRVRVGRQAKRSRARAGAYRVATPSRLRLTRRGRVLALVLVAVAVYAGFGLGRASAGPSAAPTRAATVVVGPGESIWSIAVKEFPNSDPRDVVGEIRSINHLSSAEVLVGQRLRLP
jgi:hypothetical protein